MVPLTDHPVHVRYVHRVRAHRLRIEFTDGKTTEVDFEPFLRAATHPGICRYLQPRRFKQFAITDGVLQWNDFDLVFPMADLYDGVIRSHQRNSTSTAGNTARFPSSVASARSVASK